MGRKRVGDEEKIIAAVDSWVRRVIKRRECVQVVPVSKNSSRCCCGRHLSMHYYLERKEDCGEGECACDRSRGWSVEECTGTFPTDAHGTLTFRIGKGFQKARYVRADFETDPMELWRLLVDVWSLSPPSLVITILDSCQDQSSLNPAFINAFKRGLLKAANTASTWIITSGLKTVVNEQVTAMFTDLSSRRTNKARPVQLIGMAAWGLVSGAEQLTVVDSSSAQVPYYGRTHGRQRGTKLLLEGHTAFVLVDDGTVARSADSALLARRRFEHFLASWPVLTVCVVVGGGLAALRAVLAYLTSVPAVPVLACAGTGGVADWITSIVEDDEKRLIAIIDQMRCRLGISKRESTLLAHQLWNIVQERKHLISIFRPFSPGTDRIPNENEFDVAILNCLLKSPPLSPTEKLNLTVSWGREDLAREILEDTGGVGLEWQEGSLDEAMLNSLMYDRVDLVNLLLANGINLSRFLTITRLEQLYNCENGPPNTLRFILREMVQTGKRKYGLYQVGRVMEKLMGSGYRSAYCQRAFRRRYRQQSQRKQSRKITLSLPDTVYSLSVDQQRRSIAVAYRAQPHFSNPSHELFIWAVLTNRKQLAVCFWKNGDEQLAKALLGSHLYDELAKEADEDHLEMDICRQLKENAKEFKSLALSLLDHCYQSDRDSTLRLLTGHLHRFSGLTCIDIAASSRNETFVAHQSCQVVLTDLWLGALALRRRVNLKVLAAVLFPPLIPLLTFKSKEELQLRERTAVQDGVSVSGGDPIGRKLSLREESSLSSSSDGSVSEGDSLEDWRDVGPADVAQCCSHWLDVRDQSRGKISPAPSFCMSAETLDDEANSVEIGGNQMEELAFEESSSAPACEQLRPSYGESISELEAITSTSPKLLRRFDTRLVLVATRFGPFSGKPPLAHSRRINYENKLEMGRKLVEFYSAPIAKFWSFTMGYLIFLSCFTYVVLVRTPVTPQWPEYYTIAFVATFAVDQIRKVLVQKPRRFRAKLRVFVSNVWDIWSALACVAFLVAVCLRLDGRTVVAGRITYSVTITFWYLRVLGLLSVNCQLSPYIHMYGKMVARLFLLSTILLVVLGSFGILRQSLTRPQEDWTWTLLRNVTYKPYAMLYGQIYPEEITQCDDSGENCVPGYWLTPIFMTIYLLLAMVVFMNMMVAAFNHIFTEVHGRAQEISKFESYYQVMEYQQQPFLPPPFIIFAHIHMVGKYARGRLFRPERRHRSELVLTPGADEKLHEFERDCVGELMKKKSERVNDAQARLEYLSERLDAMAAQVDHLHEKSQLQGRALTKLEQRVAREEQWRTRKTSEWISWMGSGTGRALHRSSVDEGSSLSSPSRLSQIF